MRKKNYICMLAVMLLVIMLMAETVCAAVGTITVTMEEETDVILYKISDGKEYEPDWKDAGISQEALFEKETAQILQEYAIEREIDGISGTKFENLSKGMYLIMREGVIVPFLVSVPMIVDGVEVYDIETFPKTSSEKSDIPDKDTPNNPAPSGNSGRLPQTGQLNWPIPVLAISGVLLFVVGWCVCCRKRK